MGYGSLSGDCQADVLGRLLDMQSVIGPTRESGRGHYGNALLTRATIRQVRRHDISFPGREQRGILDVDLEWRGMRMRMVVTHLGLSVQERVWQVERLLEAVKPAAGDPLTILAGDINEWVPGNRVISKVERAFGRTEHRRTFPSRMPFLPLDRIWVYPHGTLQSMWVHRSRASKTASDHLPLVGEIKLPS